LTCRTPLVPVRVNRAWVSRNRRASLIAARWACSIRAAVAGSANAHSVETLFTGRGERQVEAGHRRGLRPRQFGDVAGQLPGIQRVTAVLGAEQLAADPGTDLGADVAGHRPVTGDPPGLVVGLAGLGDRDPERGDVVGVHLERLPEPGRLVDLCQGRVGG